MDVGQERSPVILEILAAMARKDMTQGQVARAIDVSENTFSLKVQGKSEFSLPQARKLVALLDLNPLIFFPSYTPKNGATRIRIGAFKAKSRQTQSKRKLKRKQIPGNGKKER